MASPSFVKITDVNCSEFKFSKTKQTAGRRFISLFYNKQNLSVKLPKLRIPFDTKLSNYGQLEVNFSLGDNSDLIKKIKEIDAKMVVYCEELSWNSAECEYCPMLKVSKNNAYPPTVRIKIPIKNDTIETDFFDNDGTELDIKDASGVTQLLTRGNYALSAIECVGVWFNSEKWGLSWKLVQLKTSENKKEVLEACAFDTDSDAESLDSLLIQE